MAKNIEPTFRVQFVSQDKVFEVFAKRIYSSDLYGFIEVEEFVFGERSGLLVDPTEEKLKTEFQGVKRSYIPMHAVIRIDEVEVLGLLEFVIARVRLPHFQWFLHLESRETRIDLNLVK